MDFSALAASVIFSDSATAPKLLNHHPSLTLIGTGRSAFVFKIAQTDKVLKVFFPFFESIAAEEAAIYQRLTGSPWYPAVHASGPRYLVIDYIEGKTLFDCLTSGFSINDAHIFAIDEALSDARSRGLNPSDIHLRNIILTSDNQIRLIDTARFQQQKHCTQWQDLRTAYYRHYTKRYFPKKLPAFVLNLMAFLYKKKMLAAAYTPNKLFT